MRNDSDRGVQISPRLTESAEEGASRETSSFGRHKREHRDCGMQTVSQ